MEKYYDYPQIFANKYEKRFKEEAVYYDIDALEELESLFKDGEYLFAHNIACLYADRAADIAVEKDEIVFEYDEELKNRFVDYVESIKPDILEGLDKFTKKELKNIAIRIYDLIKRGVKKEKI